jgi:hypothetical protein
MCMGTHPSTGVSFLLLTYFQLFVFFTSLYTFSACYGRQFELVYMLLLSSSGMMIFLTVKLLLREKNTIR